MQISLARRPSVLSISVGGLLLLTSSSKTVSRHSAIPKRWVFLVGIGWGCCCRPWEFATQDCATATKAIAVVVKSGNEASILLEHIILVAVLIGVGAVLSTEYFGVAGQGQSPFTLEGDGGLRSTSVTVLKSIMNYKTESTSEFILALPTFPKSIRYHGKRCRFWSSFSRRCTRRNP